MIYLKFIENFIKLTKKNIFLILIISLLFAFSSSALTNKDLTNLADGRTKSKSIANTQCLTSTPPLPKLNHLRRWLYS